MHEAVERLAASLLFEGYALYPYTPGATKNATPTPFGIAYPPAYVAGQRAAFDRIRVEVVVVAGDPASVAIEGALVFLQAAGPRHQAAERRVEIPPTALEELLAEGVERTFAFDSSPEEQARTGEIDPAPAGDLVSGSLSLSAVPVAGGTAARLRFEVLNTTPLPPAEAREMDRASALRRSLLSCQSLLGCSGTKFVSPLENEGEVGAAVQACENVNTWPVLASRDDDAVLGAAILLPDHPSIADASRVNFFDNTEIEEALLLHVQVLTDEERKAIDEQDPAVREMIERAQATTSADLLELHGVMKPTEPGTFSPADGSSPAKVAFPEWSEPGNEPEPPRQAPPPGPADTAGEHELVVDGRRFRRDEKVVLRPGTDGDPYDRMMDGRVATIRRIYLDFDGRAYLGVTIDEDPMAEVFGETGRFLFFFADEVEAVA